MNTLEDFLDSRLLAKASRGEGELVTALAQLRSRAGFGGYFRHGAFADTAAVTAVLAATIRPRHSASAASLFPIEPVVLDRLCRLDGGSPLHLSLAEVVRRRYVQFPKDIDRREKEAIRAAMDTGE